MPIDTDNGPHGARYMRLAHKRIARVWFCAALAFGSVLSLPAAGLSPPPPDPFPGISVSPAIALPGIPRTLTVNGVWPNSCVPGAASVASNASDDGTVVVRLVTTLDPAAICLAALTPFSREVIYTPAREGVQRVLALTTGDRLIAQGDLVTQGAQARSLTDLTGAWHDSATSGSGLTLFHSFAGSGTLVGGWFMFDDQGKPVWLAIHNGTWVTPTVAIGQLLAHEAAPGGCGPGLNTCPKPSTSNRMLASVRIEVQGTDLLLVEAYGPQILIFPPPPQVPIIRSIVTRLRF